MDKKAKIMAQIGAALIALDIVKTTGDARQLEIAQELITEARICIDHMV